MNEVPNGPRAVDEEQRRSRDIPGIQANRVPDTVGLDHLAGLIHQDVEGKTAIFHVAAHHFGALRDDGDDLDPAIFVVFRVICQFTEPASAVRSPGAAMKREQHRTSSQEAFQRTTLSLLCRQLEGWCGGHGDMRLGRQKNFTSTISPASTMSVCGEISM